MTSPVSNIATRPADLDNARLGIITTPSSAATVAADRLRSVLEKRHFLHDLLVHAVVPDDPDERAAVVKELAATCDVAVLALIDDAGSVGLVDLAVTLEASGIPCAVIAYEPLRGLCDSRASALECPDLSLVAISADAVESLGVAGPALSLVEGSLTLPEVATDPGAGSSFACTC